MFVKTYGSQGQKGMKKLWWTLNILSAMLAIAGACFLNSFGMVLIGLAFIVGIASSIIQRIYFRKRELEEIKKWWQKKSGNDE